MKILIEEAVLANNRLPEYISIGEYSAPLTLRRNKRAKRMTLRVQPATGEVILSLPGRASISSGASFLQEKIPWIKRQLQQLPPPVPFTSGATIPILGTPHRINHMPQQRQPVLLKEQEIFVGGGEEFLARRLGDWLKQLARKEFSCRARKKAALIGEDKNITRVSVREMRSRWGSCSEGGRLAFCWRLIFAPEAVADYVIAHEVAHLQEMNHSSRFWAITDSLCSGDVEQAKSWLRQYGAGLYRYG